MSARGSDVGGASANWWALTVLERPGLSALFQTFVWKAGVLSKEQCAVAAQHSNPLAGPEVA